MITMKYTNNIIKIIYPNGTQEWWFDNELHREDGPAVEREDESRLWYKRGQLHRTDGPAVINAMGTEFWYHLGQLHRLDGPAIIRLDGRCEWYLYDTQLSPLEHFHLSPYWRTVSKEEQMHYLLSLPDESGNY